MLFYDAGFFRAVYAPDFIAFDVFFDRVTNILRGSPLENGITFMPFANLLYALVGRMVPQALQTEQAALPDGEAWSGLRDRQELLMPVIVCMVLIVIVCAISMFAFKKKGNRTLFVFFALCSAPVWIGLMGMSTTVMLLPFALMFVVCSRSENALHQKIGSVLLAIACACNLFFLLLLPLGIGKLKKNLGTFLATFLGATALGILLTNANGWGVWQGMTVLLLRQGIGLVILKIAVLILAVFAMMRTAWGGRLLLGVCALIFVQGEFLFSVPLLILPLAALMDEPQRMSGQSRVQWLLLLAAFFLLPVSALLQPGWVEAVNAIGMGVVLVVLGISIVNAVRNKGQDVQAQITLKQARAASVYEKIFVCAVAVFLLAWLCIALVMGNENFGIIYGRKLATFSDFFDTTSGMMRDSISSYAARSIYPPLANFILYAFSLLVPPEIRQQILASDNLALRARQETYAMGCFIIFILMALLLLTLVLYQSKKGNVTLKFTFVLCVMLSVPFLYLYERGNILIYAVLLTTIFVCWKDSEKRVLREVAVIALAIASAIKLYPAIFFLLYLQEKRYKEMLKFFVYAAILIFIPAMLMGGGNVIQRIFDNMNVATGTVFDEVIIHRINFDMVLPNVAHYMQAGRVPEAVLAGWGILKYILLFGGIFASFFLKETWKKTLIFTAIIVGFPSISFAYAGVFYAFPMLLFLNHERKISGMRMACFLLMLVMFIGIPQVVPDAMAYVKYFALRVSLTTALQSVANLALAVMLTVQGIVGLCDRMRQTKKAKPEHIS